MCMRATAAALCLSIAVAFKQPVDGKPIAISIGDKSQPVAKLVFPMNSKYIIIGECAPHIESLAYAIHYPLDFIFRDKVINNGIHKTSPPRGDQAFCSICGNCQSSNEVISKWHGEDASPHNVTKIPCWSHPVVNEHRSCFKAESSCCILWQRGANIYRNISSHLHFRIELLFISNAFVYFDTFNNLIRVDFEVTRNIFHRFGGTCRFGYCVFHLVDLPRSTFFGISSQLNSGVVKIGSEQCQRSGYSYQSNSKIDKPPFRRRIVVSLFSFVCGFGLYDWGLKNFNLHWQRRWLFLACFGIFLSLAALDLWLSSGISATRDWLLR